MPRVSGAGFPYSQGDQPAAAASVAAGFLCVRTRTGRAPQRRPSISRAREALRRVRCFRGQRTATRPRQRREVASFEGILPMARRANALTCSRIREAPTNRRRKANARSKSTAGASFSKLGPGGPLDRTDIAATQRIPLGTGVAGARPRASTPRRLHYTLFKIESAVPSKIRCFSCCGMFRLSIEDTARSIEPSRCG